MKATNTKITLLIFMTLVFSGMAVVSFAQERSLNGLELFLESDDEIANQENIERGSNMTQDITQEIVELYKKSNETGSPLSLEDLDLLASGALNNSKLSFDDLPELEDSDIKIKNQDYAHLSPEKREELEKADALEYLTATSYIIVNNMPERISQTSDLNKFVSDFAVRFSRMTSFSTSSDQRYFDNLFFNGDRSVEQLKEVEVPEYFIDTHKNGIQLAKHTVAIKEDFGYDNTDPIGSMVTLAKIQGTMVLMESFFNEVSGQLNFYGIDEIPLDLSL